MKKFMNLKVQTWELVVVCVILAAVVMRPGWLVQLTQELIGKILLLGALVAASLHKPYMGLLVLLLIVSIGYYREGLDGGDHTPATKVPSLDHIARSQHDNTPTSHHDSGPSHPHPSSSGSELKNDHAGHPKCNTYKDVGSCKQNNCTWDAPICK